MRSPDRSAKVVMYKMQKLIYVMPGYDYDDAQHRVILTAEEPFILSSVSGLGGVESDIISSEVVGMNGALFQGMRKSPRPVKCTVWVDGKNRENMYKERMRLIGILRGTQTAGTLYYTNDYISVRIGAVPRIPGDFAERIKSYSKADIEFYCPDPTWCSLEETHVYMAHIENAGFVLPTEMNNIMLANTVSELDIRYAGTAPSPVRIAVSGPTETPSITNTTTGKTIRLTRSLNEGELLVIHTERGKKSVILYSGDSSFDAFGYLAPTSKFWELEPGINHIVYGSGGQAQTSVRISFYDRYEGV